MRLGCVKRKTGCDLLILCCNIYRESAAVETECELPDPTTGEDRTEPSEPRLVEVDKQLL